MNEKIRLLQEKDKWHPKETLKFCSNAGLDELERAEANAVTARYWWYEEMLKAETYGPDNPPPASGLDYHRWLLKKYGLKWYVDYARRREYRDNPEGIPGRLRAMGVSEADIEAADKPIEVRVAGVSFGNRQKALERLTYYAPEEILVILVPEPENPYDPDAIAVQVLVAGAKKPYCLGYIPRTDTRKVKPFVWKIPELKIHWADTGTYSAKLKITV
jgi:hypothetical protein